MNLNELQHSKKAFITFLAHKLNIEKHTLRTYFVTGNFPAKHKNYIENMFNKQLAFDKRINEMQVEVFKD